MLRAAFGKFDYTPAPGTRLGRLGVNIHIAQGVLWPLHLRAALFDDGARRAAVVVLDQGFISAGVAAMLRGAVSEGAGVTAQGCMVSATHTHNGPALMPWRDEDTGFTFAETLARRLHGLMRDMADRLAPARLTAVRTAAPGWAWNRRAIFRGESGRDWVATHARRGSPAPDGHPFVGMEGPDESTLRAMLALRDDGSVMGGLVNFWCHPTTMYGEPVWSADFPGPLLERLESHFGGDFLYLTGPCGDLSNNGTLAQGSAQVGPEYGLSMGRALADAAITGLRSAEPVGGQDVRFATTVIPLAQRMVTPAQLAAARGFIQNDDGKTPDPALMQRLHGWPYHFGHRSAVMDRWLAEEVVGMWEWQKRVAEPVVREDVEVQALAVGGLALAAVPCELFSALGRGIVERSPARHTLAVTLANGYHGYVPTQDAFTRGGYECCLGYQSRLEPRAGAAIADAASATLARVAETS